MAGFEDDFGEMVGGKGAADQTQGDLLTNEERASDLLTNEDPAAEFLAREQEELGDLETEIGPLSGKKFSHFSCHGCQEKRRV